MSDKIRDEALEVSAQLSPLIAGYLRHIVNNKLLIVLGYVDQLDEKALDVHGNLVNKFTHPIRKAATDLKAEIDALTEKALETK